MKMDIGFDGHIDVDLLARYFVDAINKDIQEIDIYKDLLIIDIHEACAMLPSAKELYVFFTCCGITFIPYKPEDSSNEDIATVTPAYGVLRIKVPTDSEIQVRFSEKDKYCPLAKDAAARMVKSIFMKIIDSCFLRFRHEPLSYDILSVRYKEEDTSANPLSVEEFNNRIKLTSEYIDFDNDGDMSDDMIKLRILEHLKSQNDGNKDMVMKLLIDIEKCRWFGANFTCDMKTRKVTNITVPASSAYLAPDGNGEYAGKRLYDDVMSILTTYGFFDKEQYEPEMIITDVHWDREHFNEAYNTSRMFVEKFKNFIYGEDKTEQ